jgi:mono/diheme cytochrome c family protein
MRSIFLAATILLLAPSLSYAQPAVEFTEVDHDFGTVTNENKAEHVFEISNGGDEDLLIEKLVGSSGTIKAVVSSSRLKPGEEGSIRVIVDLRGKQGIYSKTMDVYTNDPVTPVTTLSVRISVKDRVHLNQYKATQIFAGNCRTCHVDEGTGKTGWELFKADCFMCHNAGRNTCLSTMSKRPGEEVLKSIKEGVPNTIMPGFDSRNGGPLDDAQIKSLIDLITP